MSFENQSITIESYAGVTIQNSLITQGSKRLIVLLPGLGYTLQAPLFHYLRNILLAQGDDVLSVQYGFQVAQSDYSMMNQPDITAECRQAIEIALKNGYEDIVFIGKSLGTPLASIFSNEFEQTSKTILLTPVQNSHSFIEKTPTLAIIGTADRVYDEALCVDTALVSWKVYDGLDHSLEVPGNMIASIQVLPHIMQACSNFLYSSATP